MQAHVDEVRRDVLVQRPGVGRVRHHPGDAVLAQQPDEVGRDETLVPHFHGMADASVAARLQAGASFQALVMPAGDLRGLMGGLRQHPEEGLEHLGVETHRGRELPEDGPQLLAQLEQARGEEVGQRRVDVAQLEHVRDVAAALDREDEAGRRVRGPGRIAGRPLQRIEGAIELQRRKHARGVLQLAPLREAGRIEVAAPGRVAPARDAYADLARHGLVVPQAEPGGTAALPRLRVSGSRSRQPPSRRSLRRSPGTPGRPRSARPW